MLFVSNLMHVSHMQMDIYKEEIVLQTTHDKIYSQTESFIISVQQISNYCGVELAPLPACYTHATPGAPHHRLQPLPIAPSSVDVVVGPCRGGRGPYRRR
jgi:hypothetical protein